MNLSYARILLIVAALSIASATAYVANGDIGDNMLLAVGTFFSIFAGILLTLIAGLSDMSHLRGRDQAYISTHRQEMKSEIARYQILFTLYLATLGLTFALFLCGATDYKEMAAIAAPYVKRGIIFLSVFSFILSFGLPSAFAYIQQRKLDQSL